MKNLLRNYAPVVLLLIGAHAMLLGTEANIPKYASIVTPAPVMVERPVVVAPEPLQEYIFEQNERNRKLYEKYITYRRNGLKKTEFECLVDNIVHEAPADYDGMLAVAVVTMNRVRDPKYPHTICGVVHQKVAMMNEDGTPVLATDPQTGKYILDENNQVIYKETCQFTWYCEDKNYPISKDRIELAKKVAYAVLHDHETNADLEGVLWYMNPVEARKLYHVSESMFTARGKRCFRTQIGPHRFYGECARG